MNAYSSNYPRRLYLALAHPWETEVSLLSPLADGSVDLHTTSCLSQINHNPEHVILEQSLSIASGISLPALSLLFVYFFLKFIYTCFSVPGR